MIKHILGVTLCGALLAVGVALGRHGHTGTHPETAWERVQRTGIVRCAYAVYPPGLDKDPNTGTLSGIMPDTLAEIGRMTGLSVAWGPEIDWSQIAVTLQTGKADAFCAGMAMTPRRGRVLAGSLPVFYGALGAFVRKGDTRFDIHAERINSPDVRIAVNMGDFSEEMAINLFPHAHRVYRGAMGGEAQLFMDVASGKADITFSGPNNMLESNGGAALRRVSYAKPLSLYAGVIGVTIGNDSLLQTMNASLRFMADNGALDSILRRHTGRDYGTYWLPPAVGYAPPLMQASE